MKTLILTLALLGADTLGHISIDPKNECPDTKPVCRDPQDAMICWCSDVTDSCEWYCVAQEK